MLKGAKNNITHLAWGRKLKLGILSNFLFLVFFPLLCFFFLLGSRGTCTGLLQGYIAAVSHHT